MEQRPCLTKSAWIAAKITAEDENSDEGAVEHTISCSNTFTDEFIKHIVLHEPILSESDCIVGPLEPFRPRSADLESNKVRYSYLDTTGTILSGCISKINARCGDKTRCKSLAASTAPQNENSTCAILCYRLAH
eukprot:TRINITY_DN2422_c0_g1_i1.p1 TRINITY_DN2422_c0_g1~~TRINITY_DN2422_c0_g1_i1.p1  ORF type:complete len:134 (-),score=12.75 TRINITY_DN2422_c0_g1_i1:474-875(-)